MKMSERKKKSAQSEKIGSEALRVLSVDFNPSESTTHTWRSSASFVGFLGLYKLYTKDN